MGIVNRRNAVLGWTVWKFGKRVAKRKVRDLVPTGGGARTGVNKPAIASIAAAVGGALLFWHKKSDGSGEQ